MSSERDEIERIRRIRERQLRARDPLAREREWQQNIARRQQKGKITFWDVLANIPAKWWGMILGALVGFVLALVLDRVLHVRLVNVDAFWVEYMWYALIFFGIVMGRGLAMAIDWGEEDYDMLVRRR
jgi:hypothetical protein